MNPLRFVAWFPGYTVWGLTLCMAFPYFQYFLTGAAVHGNSKGTTQWVLDPSKDGYGLFYPFVIATVILVVAIVWKRRAVAAGVRRAADEEAWAETLPFRMLGHPAAVGAHDHRYKVEIRFRGSSPGGTMRESVGRVDTYLKLEDIGSGRARIVADYPSNDPPARNAQRFVGALRTLTDTVLRPLHATHPIDQIDVSG